MRSYKDLRYDLWTWWRNSWAYNALYWLRTHTYNRYHMVDCRNARNGYGWGWIDRSELMLYANFAILVDFVEKERAFASHVDWDTYELHRSAKREMQALYRWWKVDRKRNHDRVEALWDEFHTKWPLESRRQHKEDGTAYWPTMEGQELAEFNAVVEFQDKIEEDDNKMLQRLIAVRGFMWT